MQKRLALIVAAIATVSCSGNPQCDQSAAPATSNTQPTPSAAPLQTAEPNRKEQTDPPSLSEAPFAQDSAQGAATIVQTYYALIEAGKYREAHQLRWDSHRLSLAEFEASFAPYAEYHATVGAPSEIQGAAGSLYVEVPVQTYGLRKDGRPFGSAGTIALRRVNDVPGATAEQRHWRIYTSD